MRSLRFLVKCLTETYDSSSDLISSPGILSRSWSLSNEMPLLLFSPLWIFPITEIFAKSFKSNKQVECYFFVALIKRAPDFSFLTDFGVPTIP